MIVRTILFSLLASVATSVPTRRATTVRGQRTTAPQGFVHQGTPSGQTTIQLRIALVPNNIAGLETALYDASTPGSSNYGKWLSLGTVKSYASPDPTSVSAVTSWLSENNITSSHTGPFGDWITFSVSVAKANSLLDAQFQTFQHTESGKTLIRTLSYSLPSDLTHHIQMVHPTLSFAPPLGPAPKFTPVKVPGPNLETRQSACASFVTPTCLQELYGVSSAPATQVDNRLAVSGFIDQWASNDDLSNFLEEVRPDIPPNTTFQLQTVDEGINDESNPGLEASLDIQYTIGVATNVHTYFISVGEGDEDGVFGFIDYVNFLNTEIAPPQVLTTSYSFNEPDLGPELATTMCNAYLALTARGVSLFYSSGDGGVSGGQSQFCTTFVPTFPSTCPFVTSVGGTTSFAPEVAASFSSGGFSEVFSIPQYQLSQVEAFLSTLGSTNEGLFNSSGRAFPDISAQSENFLIRWSGEFGLIGGTSASTPSTAAMVSLVNDQLIAAGKSVLGFLNPFIYANPQAFTDILTGNNPGCSTNGFSAGEGWDPVTGVGSPIIPEILKAAGL